MPALAALVLVLFAAPASAQREDEALTLARVCVHEAGWDSPADCAAIWRVWTRGAERTGLRRASFARAYSRRLLVERSVTRRWASGLRRDGLEPEGWPSVEMRLERGAVRVVRAPAWSAYRERWLRVLEQADAIVRGEGLALPETCEPDDWGGAMDAERAERLRLIEVECGDTRNRFFVRPRRGGAR